MNTASTQNLGTLAKTSSNRKLYTVEIKVTSTAPLRKRSLGKIEIRKTISLVREMIPRRVLFFMSCLLSKY